MKSNHLLISFAVLAMPILASSCSGRSSASNNEQDSNIKKENQMEVASKAISDQVWEQTDKVVYAFYDASVAPEYHRSFSLSATKDTATIAVYTYGETLLEEKYAVTEEQFKQAIDDLREMGIKSKKADEDAAPCDGGTSESLKLYAGDQLLFNGFQDHCEEKLSTMVVGYDRIPQAFARFYPKPVREIVNSTLDNPEEDEDEVVLE